MAKSNVLVRVEADTKNYDANIQKARKQLERFGQDNLSAGGILKQLSGNLVGVAAKFVSFGAAAAAAMKVAKDAFFKNEQQLDDWGRTVKTSESLYNGFLNSINNGSIGGCKILRTNDLYLSLAVNYDVKGRCLCGGSVFCRGLGSYGSLGSNGSLFGRTGFAGSEESDHHDQRQKKCCKTNINFHLSFPFFR